MRIPIYQIDAFTSEVFRGNHAAVCPLPRWLPDSTLQAIAAENNLSETAFFVVDGDCSYQIRWFTPVAEVELCGHATLATAFILFEMDRSRHELAFASKSGALRVRRREDQIVLDFPRLDAAPCPIPEPVTAALGRVPREMLTTRERYLVAFDLEEDVRSLRPDMGRLAALEASGVIATAPGTASDFVSRYFAPRRGVPEDPVTGSAHCTLVPYWASRLGKTHLHARQVSARGGELDCELRGDRVTAHGFSPPLVGGARLSGATGASRSVPARRACRRATPAPASEHADQRRLAPCSSDAEEPDHRAAHRLAPRPSGTLRQPPHS